MTRRLPPISSPWGLAAFTAPPPAPAPPAGGEAIRMHAPVLGWTRGPDGRPRPRWALGRAPGPEG